MRVIFIFFFAIFYLPVESQNFLLSISSDCEKITLKYKSNCKNQKEVEREIKNVIKHFYEEGYLGVQIIEDKAEEGKRIIKIKCGPSFSFGKISKGNAEEKMLSTIGFRESIYLERKLSQVKIAQLAERILTYYENNGYPFVSFHLDSLIFNKEVFSGSLQIEKNQFYKIDSLVIKGDKKVAEHYISNFIEIKEGDVYNEKRIRAIDTRLKEISFLEVIKPTEITFTENQCYVYIYLKNKKASSFNGVLGILPDNITGKVTINGDARIRIVNGFKTGELLDFNWRKLNNNIQDLRMNVNFPFVFKSPFGLDGIFKLYKKDTSFIELNLQGGIQYILRSGNFLKLSYLQQSTSILNPNQFLNVNSLPGISDVNSSLYGIGTKFERLDYRLNPRKGYSLSFDFQAGLKNIKPNPSLADSLYSQIKLRTTKFNLSTELDFYLPILKRATLKLATQTAWLENENLFTNELYRIGGLKKLRGFNEESIFASFYSINTLEFRYLLDQNSFLYAFYDYCYYENKTIKEFIHDTPMSFGAGISFQTRAGIFTMNYALGKEKENPFLLRGAKIHFGFINYF